MKLVGALKPYNGSSAGVSYPDGGGSGHLR